MTGASSAVIGGSKLWVTGGEVAASDITDTTEVLDVDADGSWTAGPELPMALSEHCIVPLDNDKTVVTGGKVGERLHCIACRRQYITCVVNHIQLFTSAFTVRLKRGYRNDASIKVYCPRYIGVSRRVSDGYRSTWMYDWTTGRWRELNEMADTRFSHACSAFRSAATGDTLVAVVGGMNSRHIGEVSASLMRMELLDLETGEWTLTEHSLPYTK